MPSAPPCLIYHWVLLLLQVVYKLADWIKDHPMTEKRMTIPLQLAGGSLLKSLGKSATGGRGRIEDCKCSVYHHTRK